MLVWTIYDCAGGGVTPPSQIVVPLSTEKKYKPDAVDVDDIASVVLSGPARVSVTAIVSVISSVKVVTTVVKAGLAAAVELTMSELAPYGDSLARPAVSVTVAVIETVATIVEMGPHADSILWKIHGQRVPTTKT